MSTEFTKPELPAIGFLKEFDQEQRDTLSSFGEFLPAHQGDVVIQEGAAQESLYFIISGLLHATTEIEGRRTLLGSAKQGDVLGEVSIFDPGEASATVTAMEFSQVWRINREMLEEVLNENPEIGNVMLVRIATQLSRRLRAANQRVTDAQKAIGDSLNWVF